MATNEIVCNKIHCVYVIVTEVTTQDMFANLYKNPFIFDIYKLSIYFILKIALRSTYIWQVPVY